jgi:5'(3')-deoxyribonucleotidase
LKPTVLLDVDGVIANFTQLYLSCAKAAGVLSMEFPSDWESPYEKIEEALHLTKDGEAAVYKLLNAPDAAFNINPYPKAVEGVKSVAEIAEVYFVTNPIGSSPTWSWDRMRWLKKHFGDELGGNVVLTPHKFLVRGDIFVDDRPSNLEPWKKAWPYGIEVCWDQPYNQDWKSHKVNMWEHVVELARLCAGTKRGGQ